MKKGLKFGIASLLVLGMISGLFVSLNQAEAATKSNNSLTLTIGAFNGGKNTCTGANYTFSTTAKVTSQTVTDSHSFTCAFGTGIASSVTLQMSGNMTGPVTISGSDIKLKNAEWTATPSDLKAGTNAISSYTAFNVNPAVLFTKAANKIGTGAGSAVDIQITIPAGAPDGTYNGTIVLSY